MDIREVKTKRSITNAFLELRAKKPLEKISIKELAETAEISKATFYLHYKDIYDLSEQLQKDLIQNIISAIPDPNQFLSDSAAAHKMLQNAFFSYQSLIDILFSGSQEPLLPKHIEEGLKTAIFKTNPALKDDVKANTTLSFLILGGFYAYLNNAKTFSAEEVSASLGEILVRYNTYQNPSASY